MNCVRSFTTASSALRWSNSALRSSSVRPVAANPNFWDMYRSMVSATCPRNLSGRHRRSLPSQPIEGPASGPEGAGPDIKGGISFVRFDCTLYRNDTKNMMNGKGYRSRKSGSR